MVERLFLAVPRGCLQFVIVVFPDHTHLLFFIVRTSLSPDMLYFCEGGTYQSTLLLRWVSFTFHFCTSDSLSPNPYTLLWELVLTLLRFLIGAEGTHILLCIYEDVAFALLSSRLRAKKRSCSPPPLGNFADTSYLEENFKPHLLRDVCTLCSGALVSDSLLHMLL